MSLYKKMYYQLFNDVSRAIELLQKSQQRTEELYLQEDQPPQLRTLDSYRKHKKKPE